jgi:hypothetical protein
MSDKMSDKLDNAIDFTFDKLDWVFDHTLSPVIEHVISPAMEKIENSKAGKWIGEHPIIFSIIVGVLASGAMKMANGDFDDHDTFGNENSTFGMSCRSENLDGMDQDTEISLFQEGWEAADSEERPWFISEEDWEYINGS